MVFFTCSHCGESVRKNKVEKHYQTVCSRNPISVTCVDCCKDFSAETFPAHTKCVSEEEKYSAKGFQPKPSANKGEQKQQKWQEVIEAVREKNSKKLSYNESTILDVLVKHENVPRKRVKFQNFLRSILKKQYNAGAADSLFDMIEAESKQNSGAQDKSEKLNETNGEEKVDTSMEVVKENSTEEQSEEKLSKKEKKEKKKRAKYEAELKEIEANQMPEDEEEIESKGQKKKKSKSELKENGIIAEEENSKKKNKINSEEDNAELNGITGEEEKKSKKKKKHTEENNMEEKDVNEERPKKKRKMIAEENNTQENGIVGEEGQKKKKKGRAENVEENGETNMDMCETGELENDEQERKKSKKKDKKYVEIEVEGGEKGKKKRKKEMVEDAQDEEPSEKKAKEVDPDENLAEETSTKGGKTKFNWQDIILQVLRSKEEKEMSLKRLRKKVLAEFESLGCGSATDEKNIGKFNKKVNHTPGVVVLKDVAKLVSVE